MDVKEKILIIVFYGASILSAAITLIILGFMVVLSFPIFSEGLFFNILTKPWSPDQGLFGLGPIIVGTLCIALLALIISFPVSLGCSFFVGILNPKGLGRHFKKFVELMTAIPTVIYGFVGIFLLVPLVREIFLKGSGLCILSASIMLAILISPTMILFFVQSFKTVPQNYLNAVDALGGNIAQKFFYVILPNTRKGIMTGIILSFGRAVGDTLIALMISGNSVAFPGSVLDSARTLTAQIALLIAADFESIEFKTLFVCGICLYIITSSGVLMARYSTKKKRHHI
ncbi:MAG: ABC transporter permease subunit [Desulfobacteraceae bacterium]|nr:ABC transporter permease subunit [Desulfobacteraceae bacterium]